MDSLIGVEEYASMANTTPATIRYWVTTGYAAPSAKLGRRRVWKRDVVTEWIEDKFADDASAKEAG